MNVQAGMITGGMFVVSGGALGQFEDPNQSADRVLQQFPHSPQKNAIRLTSTVSTCNTRTYTNHIFIMSTLPTATSE